MGLVPGSRRKWQPTPAFLPGKSQGRRSLVGCSPWGHEVGDPTVNELFAKGKGWGRNVSESRSVVSDSLRPHELYSPWNSPVQNTGVGSLSLLQGIFPTQGLNPGLPHCRQILYQLSHKGSSRILEWVAYPFSSRSLGSLSLL